MFRAGFHRVNLLDEEKKTKYIVAVDKDGKLAVLLAQSSGLTCHRQSETHPNPQSPIALAAPAT